jgi:2C-methyl-D-erythritol 2,4-cyclodiphosphate synthase
MSWLVQATGKVDAVMVSVDLQFEDLAPRENAGEEAARQAVRQLIASTLRATAPDTAVRVTANGSCMGSGNSTQVQVVVGVEPIYGFLD